MKEPRRGTGTTEFYFAISGAVAGGAAVVIGWQTQMALAGMALVAVSIYSYVSGRSRAKAAAATDLSLNPPKRVI